MFNLAQPLEPNARAFGHSVNRVIALVAASILIPTFPASAKTLAAPPIVVDGSNVTIRALERNNNVFVPVRGVFEKLGAEVTYAPPGSIVARKNGKELAHLTVGSKRATVNGGSQMLRVAPFAAQGRVMVPLRLISEAAGATVAYVASPRTVQITHRTTLATVPILQPVASAAPAAAAVPVAEQSHGFPWWLWLLIALALLTAILLMLRPRRKEPIIRTSSGRSDPTIETRR